ncbi:Retrovirus-related Pol polyprotein from transposon TNT 1-94 [Sesbania bispinosa]|nr:Retrovirus-related Pol polyprotein from transposon TNT 1-94 [Sesbania bispinosa]
MSNTIRIEKFNGKNSFNLWRIKMRALLKEQRIWSPLASISVKKENFAKSEEKPTTMKKEDCRTRRGESSFIDLAFPIR